VSTLDTPSWASTWGSAPWNSAGYSRAPTPTMTPWPGMSRGTEWTVPSVPGLVSVIVTPAKSAGVMRLVRTRRMTSS
jgi:hypothetical protein